MVSNEHTIRKILSSFLSSNIIKALCHLLVHWLTLFTLTHTKIITFWNIIIIFTNMIPKGFFDPCYSLRLNMGKKHNTRLHLILKNNAGVKFTRPTIHIFLSINKDLLFTLTRTNIITFWDILIIFTNMILKGFSDS